MCYSVSNKLKPSTIPSRKCRNVFGPRLYKSLPKYLRNIESVKTEKFKFRLDKFLEIILDEQKMPNYVTTSGSNSILYQLTHLRAQGIYQSDGVPDSITEQSKYPNHSKYPGITKSYQCSGLYNPHLAHHQSLPQVSPHKPHQAYAPHCQ